MVVAVADVYFTVHDLGETKLSGTGYGIIETVVTLPQFAGAAVINYQL